MAECVKYEYGIEDFQGRVLNYTRVEQAVLDSAVNTLEAMASQKESNVCHLFSVSTGDERHNEIYLDGGCAVIIRKRKDNDTFYHVNSIDISSTPLNKGELEKVVNELGLPAPKI